MNSANTQVASKQSGFFFFFCLFAFTRAASEAYGGFQARGESEL